MKKEGMFHKVYIIILLMILLLTAAGIIFYLSGRSEDESVKPKNTENTKTEENKEDKELSDIPSENDTADPIIESKTVWLTQSYKTYIINGNSMLPANETTNLWERYNGKEDVAFIMNTENKQYNMKNSSVAERKGSISKIIEIVYENDVAGYSSTITSIMYKNTDVALNITADEGGEVTVIQDIAVEKESLDYNKIILNTKDNITGEKQDYVIYPDGTVVKTVYKDNGDKEVTTTRDYYYNNGIVAKLIDIERYSGGKKTSGYYMKAAGVKEIDENTAHILVEQYAVSGNGNGVKNGIIEYVMKKYKRENGKLTLYKE